LPAPWFHWCIALNSRVRALSTEIWCSPLLKKRQWNTSTAYAQSLYIAYNSYFMNNILGWMKNWGLAQIRINRIRGVEFDFRKLVDFHNCTQNRHFSSWSFCFQPLTNGQTLCSNEKRIPLPSVDVSLPWQTLVFNYLAPPTARTKPCFDITRLRIVLLLHHSPVRGHVTSLLQPLCPDFTPWP
jgi:hypothetical protein